MRASAPWIRGVRDEDVKGAGSAWRSAGGRAMGLVCRMRNLNAITLVSKYRLCSVA